MTTDVNTSSIMGPMGVVSNSSTVVSSYLNFNVYLLLYSGTGIILNLETSVSVQTLLIITLITN